MSQATSSADDFSTDLFSYEAIAPHIDVPDEWDLVAAESSSQFAGYNVVGHFLIGDEQRGYLLSDSEYRRICCVVYPPKTAFHDTRVEASTQIGTKEDLEYVGEQLSDKIELCHE